MRAVQITRGETPLILAIPHTGLYVPDEIWSKFNSTGRRLADTDWHIEKLYDGLVPQASRVRALFHRYVIDANRDPQDHSLYPGQNTTTLCPITDFDGRAIYNNGMCPDAAEIAQRRILFHKPYHNALQGLIEHIRKRFGYAIVFDCHSIRSRIPYLFTDKLPDLNIGTNDARSCAGNLEQWVVDRCAKGNEFSVAINARFKGGWTTRHYGRPQENIHVIQMELAQSTYLTDEMPPFGFDQKRAEKLRNILDDILEGLTRLIPVPDTR